MKKEMIVGIRKIEEMKRFQHHDIIKRDRWEVFIVLDGIEFISVFYNEDEAKEALQRVSS